MRRHRCYHPGTSVALTVCGAGKLPRLGSGSLGNGELGTGVGTGKGGTGKGYWERLGLGVWGKAELGGDSGDIYGDGFGGHTGLGLRTGMVGFKSAAPGRSSSSSSWCRLGDAGAPAPAWGRGQDRGQPLHPLLGLCPSLGVQRMWHQDSVSLVACLSQQRHCQRHHHFR